MGSRSHIHLRTSAKHSRSSLTHLRRSAIRAKERRFRVDFRLGLPGSSSLRKSIYVTLTVLPPKTNNDRLHLAAMAYPLLRLGRTARGRLVAHEQHPPPDRTAP